ncbi:ABC transporter substrate-binding protein [Microbacterium sp. gxy059]|uniref:ABC transporter substrate-binding protein n=1 Tax=Microbacterium sp. gxy059 TaxID=2957199 RepID=UPI003D9545BB
MFTKKRSAAVLAAAVTTALTLSACSGGGSGGGGDESDVPAEIVVAKESEPTRVADPIIDGSLAGYSWYYALFDTLTILTPDGEIVPRLSTEWESSDDLMTWTFNVREGVTFTNGDPLTAHDVAFTYNQILSEPDSSPRSYMQPLESAEAIDDTTVEFHLNTPFSPFPSITTSVSIVPEDTYTEMGSEAFAEAPVGSGPYQFTSRNVGVDYVIERNDDYWGEQAPYEKITFQTIADEDARLNGVLSSSVDVALIAPNQVDSVSGAAEAMSQESNGVTFFGMNSTEGPLQDQKVRRAVELAIDKQSLVDNVLDGRASVASQMIAPAVAGYDDSLEVSDFDPDQARELLDEAGYDGTPITLSYASAGRIPLSAEYVQAVQAMLQDVGFEIELEGMDQSTFSDRVYSDKDMPGIYLNTYAPSQMDGDPVIEDMFAGGYNDYAMEDETDELVDLTRETEGEERVEAYGDLMRYNEENSLLIPLYVPDTNFVVSDDVEFDPRADGLYLFFPIGGEAAAE